MSVISEIQRGMTEKEKALWNLFELLKSKGWTEDVILTVMNAGPEDRGWVNRLWQEMDTPDPEK